jgi:hypothetical protein
MEFEAAVYEEFSLPKADVIVPERETGRDTADLIAHSELHKQRKRINGQTDGFAEELEIKKQPN